MDKMKYSLLTEVMGRWKADILESFLKSEEIDVVLIQEAVSHLTHTTSFAPVKIYVPKASIKQARNLLKTFNETQDDSKEKIDMASKKKIEEREKVRRAKQTERTIQMVGGGIVLLILAVLAFMYLSNREPAAQEPAAVETPQTSTLQYDAYPPMTIDVNKEYFAVVKMANGGEFTIQLFPDKAPKTVNSFVFLAREGYFNGVTFHRVLEGFMAQGGDPTGTGMGGPGYEFENENSDLTFDKEGVVAMANAGPDTNGSQFFITFGPTPQLNGGYTIFGQVIEGMDVVNAITKRDPDTSPTFAGDAMESITITEQ
jgi:peptidylprolyl isomerase